MAAAVAQAQDPGTLLVVVVDARTGKPIDSAQVFILGGDSPQASLTNKDGKLEFPGMGVGTYSVLVKSPGHLDSAPTKIDIVADQLTTVRVTMESQSAAIAGTPVPTSTSAPSSDLKIIATVQSRASVDVSVVPLSQAERGVSQSLAGALGGIAGVLNGDTGYDADSAFNISLHGHDASQTGFTIDGVPVIDSGSLAAGQLLFSGASVNFSPTAGYAGGMVNFTTLQPSRLWTYTAVGKIGNLGAADYSFSASGSSGKFMFAMQDAYAAQDSLRSGLYYADQSGNAFLHQGATDSTAQLFKLQYQLSPKTAVHLTEMLSNQSRGTICSDFTTLAACGWGSVPIMTSRYLTTNLSIESLMGNMQVYFGMFGSQSHYGTAEPSRIEYGTPMSGYSTFGTNSNLGFFVSATAAARQSTLTYSALTYGFNRSSSQTYNGIPVSLPQPKQSSYRVGIYDRVKSSDKVTLQHGVSVAGATGAGTQFVAQEAMVWQPSRADTFQGQVSVGSAQPSFGAIVPVGDALSASYDCYNGSTYVNGPNDQNTKQSSTSYDVTWRHNFKRGYLNTDVYSASENGQGFFPGAVPVAAASASVFPGGLQAYLQQLMAVWSQPTVCGAIPFDPTRVYLSQDIVGMRQDQRGYSVSGEAVVGNNVVLFPNYSMTSTFFATLDPRLEAVGSYYAIGRQLPHHPLVQAGLTADIETNGGALEWFLQGQYQSLNNPANLPAFTTVNVGLNAKLRYGTLSFIESNVFGTYADLFGTYRGIDPMPLVGGGTFAFSSDPGQPRQWSVMWTIPWHQHYSPPQQHAPPKPLPKPSASPSAAPSASPAPHATR